jgi:hypothetical protein
MKVDKLEALVDAIASLNGYSTNPDSDAYQLRSPILVKNFSRPGQNEIDDRGRRVFSSALAGYRAALFDLKVKCSGTSRAGLKADDKLSNLLRVLGISEILGQKQIVKFLKRALKDETITTETPLAYFRSEDGR